MPSKKKGVQQIKRTILEKLLFGERDIRRFTQDSAILPDVWMEYGKNLNNPIDLLLTPYKDKNAGKVASLLETRLEKEQSRPGWKKKHKGTYRDPAIAYNQSTVAAKLYFDEMVRVVLPMTQWWNQYIDKEEGNLNDLLKKGDSQRIAIHLLKQIPKAKTPEELERQKINAEMLWLIRIVGTIEYARTHPVRDENILPRLDGNKIFSSFAEVVRDIQRADSRNDYSVFTVSRNRQATAAIFRSVLSVKGDAARSVFKSAGKGITWAVIDSGIDAEHPAFRLRDSNGQLLNAPFYTDNNIVKNQTRVKETYDFTRIRDLLSGVRKSQKGKKNQLDRLDPEHAQELRSALKRGGFIDWDLLARQFKIEHKNTEYERPGNDHGTHVAGILAGDCRKGECDMDENEDLLGMCPDMELFDLRVLDQDGVGDEFSIQAALQFVRHLNAHKDYTVIHGVNLSLSIRHDVANYACGATPVCEECERLVNAGIVVVAAAGNEGYLHYMTVDGDTSEGYRSISITDPGNADGVITVGSTHAFRPHAYGVSYFSSRGPTGDGRCKPDLVAPGEKILSAVPGNGAKRKDGTSMAAPHVSGAAALLMSRHREFIGRPRRIKEILCRTATDLGRERYFQGSGMVDILRALQSV